MRSFLGRSLVSSVLCGIIIERSIKKRLLVLIVNVVKINRSFPNSIRGETEAVVNVY